MQKTKNGQSGENTKDAHPVMNQYVKIVGGAGMTV